MAVLTQLSELDLFLMSVENDEEDAPWMVMADLQVRGVDLLKPILLLHAERNHLPWYIASYLLITTPRPEGERTLDAAPDLMVAEAEDWLRTSWSIPAEGKAPEFVLELSSSRSLGRDSGDKPRIYGSMGVTEYVLFAPERTDGPKLLGWQRTAAGTFTPWHVDHDGVLWCRTLGGLGLYIVGGMWLRAQDADGRPLPTPGELLLAEQRQVIAEASARADAERMAAQETARADAETARADAETARADAETARASAEAAARADAERRVAASAASREAEAFARTAAEAEVARLREELRRLREE